MIHRVNVPTLVLISDRHEFPCCPAILMLLIAESNTILAAESFFY
jgi:hypothetical protein